MRNSHLSNIILSLNKQKNKLIYIDELKALCTKELGEMYTDKKVYKLIYHLKNKGYLVSLKKEIFCITQPSHTFSETEYIEQYYRQILIHHMQSITSKRYIGGLKALELHYHNTDIPDQILIINNSKQRIDTLVAGKTLHAKTYTQQKKPLFALFNTFTTKIKIEKQAVCIACKELAILEALFSYDETYDKYTAEYIKKVLKKHEPDLDILEQILHIGKHHTSINRFLELIKATRPKLVEPVKQLIKKYSFLIQV